MVKKSKKSTTFSKLSDRSKTFLLEKSFRNGHKKIVTSPPPPIFIRQKCPNQDMVKPQAFNIVS